MWKKLIITIPLIICLIVPTLVISSSAASLTVVDDMVVNNFKSRIGYEINDNTYWSPDENTLMRVHYPERRQMQFMLNTNDDSILNGNTTRIFSFEINLAMFVMTNQRVDFELTYRGEEGYYIGLGSEIYSKNTSAGLVSSSNLINYGSCILKDDGKTLEFQILNVTSTDTIYVSFGFQQVFDSPALIFDCNFVPGMTFLSQDNPDEHLITTSSSFSGLFYSDDITGYFNFPGTSGNGVGSIPRKYDLVPEINGTGIIFRALVDGEVTGKQKVDFATVTFNPYWVRYKDSPSLKYKIDDTRVYRVGFILQLGNQGQICYAEFLKNLKLSATTFEGTFNIPASNLWSEETADGTKKSFALFDFDIRGSILNNAKWTFEFNTDGITSVNKYSYLNFYFVGPFFIIARSVEYTEQMNEADFILNAGINVGVGDFGSSNIQVLQQSLVNLESSYTISSADISKLNQHATNLLSNGNFKSASTVITGFIDRFSVENSIYWGLMLACLTLGIVFYFIGRGKG